MLSSSECASANGATIVGDCQHGRLYARRLCRCWLHRGGVFRQPAGLAQSRGLAVPYGEPCRIAADHGVAVDRVELPVSRDRGDLGGDQPVWFGPTLALDGLG